MSNASANDQMIRRLETELREKETFANGLIERCNAGNRDLNEDESQLMAETRSRMESIKGQLEQLQDINRVAYETRSRAAEVDAAIATIKGQPRAGEVEYRSAGEWALDTYKGHLGDRQAQQRLEVYYRAAQHQKTSDNLGVVPDPIVGDVINFVDAARPVVSLLGPRSLPSSTWHRPKVTQHASVAKQGSAGAAADEKSELVSQKMTITRLNATAVTYGGYVNVSRQNIDFSQPSVLDLVINDLASQYAIETEAATATALSGVSTAAVSYGAVPTASLVAAALWDAASSVYTAVKGQGRVVLAVAPDVLSTFGPLFQPVNPQNAQSPGLSAGNFGQGVLGTISGIPVVMSAGLGSGDAVVFSTAAIEVYEQRVGTLQVTEPSVLGVQVAYAGYFTPLVVHEAGIVPLVQS